MKRIRRIIFNELTVLALVLGIGTLDPPAIHFLLFIRLCRTLIRRCVSLPDSSTSDGFCPPSFV